MKNIMDKNKNSYQYQEAIEIQFQSICEPLYNLGVKWFGYIKIFPDGSYLLAAPSHKEIREHYLNTEILGLSPTRELESSLIGQSHCAMFASDISLYQKTTDPLLNCVYSYDLWPVFCIYRNSLEFGESCAFAMDRKDQYMSQFFLNNLNLLEHFFNYFNDRAMDIIDCSDKNKLAYFKQTFNLCNQSKESFRAQEIKKFLQETYI